MKSFLSTEYIQNLNALHSGGVFFRAVTVSVETGTTLYLADTDDVITFDGHAYTPMPMQWQGVGQNAQQSLPTITVSVANVNGLVGEWLETTNVLGRDVTLQLLHRDLLGTVTDQDSLRVQILAVEWTQQLASFHVGLNLALQEVLPRHLITAAEFPGAPEGYRRASIL